MRMNHGAHSQRRWHACAFLPLLVALLGALAVAIGAPAHADKPRMGIMAWGQESSGKSDLGVNRIRMGCGQGPEACRKDLEMRNFSAAVHDVALSLGFMNEDGFLAKQTPGYLKLLADYPKIHEIGMDDFFGFMSKMRKSTAAQQVVDFTTALKSAAPVQFRVTIYDQDLDRIHKDSKRFPLALRSQVDQVAFFLRLRANAERYETLVDQVQQLFPRAQVHAGIYHYDRIDYIACAAGKKDHCTQQQELAWFQLALHKQLQLVASGKLAGLELYPGFIGEEPLWKGWQKPAICRPERLAACVNNSQAMGAILRSALESSFSSSFSSSFGSAPTIKP